MAEAAFLAQYQLLARYNRWFNECLYDEEGKPAAAGFLLRPKLLF